MYKHIHIFGASGSGATTIAKKVSTQVGYSHFDSDDYFWLKTDEPYTEERDKQECLDSLKTDLQSNKQWILSGSLTGWGEELLPFFDLVIFVQVPSDIRIVRLKNREIERYGDKVLPGGERYKDFVEFIGLASKYDTETTTEKNLLKHQSFLNTVECKTILLENISLEESIDEVIAQLIR